MRVKVIFIKIKSNMFYILWICSANWNVFPNAFVKQKAKYLSAFKAWWSKKLRNIPLEPKLASFWDFKILKISVYWMRKFHWCVFRIFISTGLEVTFTIFYKSIISLRSKYKVYLCLNNSKKAQRLRILVLSSKWNWHANFSRFLSVVGKIHLGQ